MSVRKAYLIWSGVTVGILGLVSLVLLFPQIAGLWRWHQVSSKLSDRGEILSREQILAEVRTSGNNYFEMPYLAEVDRPGAGTGSRADRLKKALDASRNRPQILPAYNIQSKLDFSGVSLDTSASQAEKEADGLRLTKDLIAPFEDIRDEAVSYKNRSAGYSKTVKLDLFGGVGAAGYALMELLDLHCKVALAEGRMGDAKDDVLALAAFARATTMNEAASRDALSGQYPWSEMQILIWLGMEKWTSEDLKTFQTLMNDAMPDMRNIARNIRSDRAALHELLEDSKIERVSWWPDEEPPFPWRRRSFLLLARANYYAAAQEWIDAFESDNRDPATYDRLLERQGGREGLARFSHGLDHCVFRYHDPAYYPMRSRDEAQLTRIALAIELFVRTNGHLPEQLQKLVPDYIDEIPKPVISGQSFQYLRIGPGAYRIWSSGGIKPTRRECWIIRISGMEIGC